MDNAIVWREDKGKEKVSGNEEKTKLAAAETTSMRWRSRGRRSLATENAQQMRVTVLKNSIRVHYKVELQGGVNPEFGNTILQKLSFLFGEKLVLPRFWGECEK